MAGYIRRRVPGGRYFFTVALAQRRGDLLIRRIDDLRASFASVMQRRPFRIDAIVVLPDQIHTIWDLPERDADFSSRWKEIKCGFTRRIGGAPHPRPSLARKSEAGIWQRRFWEHCIRDAADLEAHRTYCWHSPVREGLVNTPTEWTFSSIHRDTRLGRVDTGLIGADLPGSTRRAVAAPARRVGDNPPLLPTPRRWVGPHPADHTSSSSTNRAFS